VRAWARLASLDKAAGAGATARRSLCEKDMRKGWKLHRLQMKPQHSRYCYSHDTKDLQHLAIIQTAATGNWVVVAEQA
jgi:hypothetical protein